MNKDGMIPKPTNPCYRCGGTDYWLRDKGWGKPEYLCSVCHPNPNATRGVQMPLYFG
jgi:hypothetical protein